MTARRRNLLSVFSGPGGLDEGFRQAGFQTKLAYDVDYAAIRTIEHNHQGTIAIQEDIRQLEVADVIRAWKKSCRSAPIGILGGAPCQSFSVANRFQSSSDPRNALPWHFARLVEGLHKEFDLDFFLFENVPGLASRRHKLKLERLKGRLRRAGFGVFQGLLDAQHFGVPQVRARVFVVGINEDKYGSEELILPSGNRSSRRTVADAIRGLPKPLFFSRQLNGRRHPKHPNHWCMTPKSHRFAGGLMVNPRKRSFRVLGWDQPSYTVAYGHREVHVHPSGRRRLSVFEAMLLQGFPRSYELLGTLSDQIRLVSEAVPPPVAKSLGLALRRQLDL